MVKILFICHAAYKKEPVVRLLFGFGNYSIA